MTKCLFSVANAIRTALVVVCTIVGFYSAPALSQTAAVDGKPMKLTMGGNIALHIFLPAQVAKEKGFMQRMGSISTLSTWRMLRWLEMQSQLVRSTSG